MEPVTQVTGRAVPLDRADVDTDQIIPASWLKRIERTGFGEGLFSAWRADPGFVLNRAEYDGATSPGGRPQLRFRLVPGARRLGPAGLRLRRRHLSPLRRHLPRQLPQDRPPAGGAAGRDGRHS